MRVKVEAGPVSMCVSHVHSSCAEGIEGLYSKELGIRYTEFEHIVVGHVSIM